MISLSEIEERGIDLPMAGNPEDMIRGDSLDDEVAAALDSLDNEFRDAVLLADLEELSYKEISDLLGCPIGTVMSRLYRGRSLLRKKLRNYAIQHGYIRKEG